MRKAKYRSWQPTYISWARMISRCTDPKNNRYYRYGARGITVCKRWLVYENFLADMGTRPDGMTLDRKNINGNYNKRNCRWISKNDQMANTSRSLKFLGIHSSEWARRLGVKRQTIDYRIKRGIDPRIALSKDGRRLPRNRRNGAAVS